MQILFLEALVKDIFIYSVLCFLTDDYYCNAMRYKKRVNRGRLKRKNYRMRPKSVYFL